MPRAVRSETVIPRQLSPEAQGALTDELYELIHDTFGVTRDDVLHGVVAPNSDLTKILVHRNQEGKAVGYFAVHFFTRELRGVPTTVVRAGVGMHRDYRGQNNNLSWSLGVLAEHVVAHPRTPLYGLGTMVHPTSYLQVDRYVEVYWPKPGEPVPPDILQFMLELADAFRMPLVDPARPLVRKSSYRTLETEAERDYWRRSDRPAARFFVSMIPDYHEGHGMLTLFPITPAMLAGTAARFARDKAARAFEDAMLTAQSLPLGQRLLRPAAVKKLLRATPLFAGLDDANLGRLVERAEILRLPGGSDVLRAGDDGEEVYVVARGAVRVIQGPEADGMVDQLGAGSMFGEIAALSGGRRSATIRTAIPTTLVRIPGAAVRALMAERADVGEAIWGAFAARLFEDHLRASGGAPGLERSAREEWVRRGRHEDVEAGAVVATEGDALLLLLRGAASVQRGAAHSSAEAPFVIETDASTRVAITTAARVVHVPPREASGTTRAW